MVIQSTHRLYVTDEVRLVAALHALSEIEVKLKFFFAEFAVPGTQVAPLSQQERIAVAQSPGE